MKVSVEFAAAAVGLGALAFVAWRASSAVGSAVGSAVQAVATTAGDLVHAVNPVNPDNVFAGGVNAAGRAATGDPYWTLGGWFYDATHSDAGAVATTPVPRIDFGYPGSW